MKRFISLGVLGKETQMIISVLAFILIVFGFATDALAQQLFACARNNNGQLRLASGPGQCDGNETAVSWNIAGPQGPAGPAGPQGPEGPEGPAGVSGYEVVFDSTQQNGDAFRRVPCPPGKVPLGGGLWINEGGQFDSRRVVGTHPYGEPFLEHLPPIGWAVRANHDGPYALMVWAICAFAD